MQRLRSNEKTFIYSLVSLVVLFQLFTLRFPGINGDEGLLSLTLTEPLSLNPVMPYTGAINFWLYGSVYWITQWLTWLPAKIWMVRIIPLILFCSSIAIFYRQVLLWSKELANWCLYATLIMPIVLVYSRFAWSVGLVFASCAFLLSECLRILRTQTVRWYLIALAGGLAIDAHPIGYLGLGVTLLPCLPLLWKDMRRHWVQVLGAAFLLLALTYPVLRNFPPPADGGFGDGSLWIQVRSWINILTGIQPFEFFFGGDPAPELLVVCFGLFLFVLSVQQIVDFFRSRETLDRILSKVWIAHFLGLAFLLFMGARGRTLKLPGSERYFLFLVPGWILLLGDSLRRFFEKRLHHRLRVPLLLGLFLAVFGRFSEKLLEYRGESDPYYSAAHWLMEKCPRSQCVAYAENYWNYWSFRYYTRSSLDLNFVVHNWIKVPSYPPGNRIAAGCWHDDSPFMYRGPFIEKVSFPAQMIRPGQVCFFGINPPPLRY